MIRPMIVAEMSVPAKASALIAPILRKNGFTCSEKPASNMMGGSNAIKKNSVCLRQRSSSDKNILYISQVQNNYVSQGCMMPQSMVRLVIELTWNDIHET